LVALRDGERAVGDLARGFRGSQPAFSRHVKVLIDAGLLTQRRDGKRMLCQLELAPLTDVIMWAELFRELWLHKLDDLDHYLRRTHGPDTH
jgi:DNA-binding transcriptional ArsR family regulator